jgi:hypothetical protein
MMVHLPGKTAKQIRDKRREPSYRALVDRYQAGAEPSATQEPDDCICLSSESESETRTTTRHYVSETEDEQLPDEDEVT